MANGNSGVAILLDFENLFFQARNDSSLGGYSDEMIALAIAAALDEIAQKQGTILQRFGAFSLLPSKKTNHRRRRQMGSWLLILQGLTDCGYRFLLVRHGDDAADRSIADIGLQVVTTSGAKTCVLATGDGKEPFPSLCDSLTAKGVKIHVVSYDYVPASVKERPDITSSIIAGSVLRLLAEVLPQKAMPHPDLRETAMHTPTGEGGIRDSVRLFIKNPDDPAIEPQHRTWIRKAIAAIAAEKEKRARKEVRFEALLALLGQTFPNGEGLQPSEGEVRLVLTALIQLTDLFERKSLYLVNPGSSLLRG